MTDAPYTLLDGDCREVLRTIPDGSVDAVITDPIYPEVDRDYGRISAADWMDLMRAVIPELRRVLKPTGSAMLILQPNSEMVGRMNTWLWEFLVWVGRKWNIVQDTYWCNTTALPGAHATNYDLMRQSIKYCVWLGPPDCYRDQISVLWSESQRNALQRMNARAERKIYPSGQSVNRQTIAQAAEDRGGVTPFNMLPFGNHSHGTNPVPHPHSARTPITLARWWTRYICPPGGVVLDPFAGVGSIGVGALLEGRRYIGIERQPHYIASAEQWLAETAARQQQEMAL